MSDYLAGKVWRSDLDGDLKPLAAALANCGSDDGTSIYPSIAYLAWKLSRSERAVQYGMGKLKELGIVVILNGAAGGRGKTPNYRLMESALPAREAWSGSTTALEKGATYDEKGATYDTKGCSLEQERVQPIAPDKVVEQVVETTKSETLKPVELENQKQETECRVCGATGLHNCGGWRSEKTKEREKRRAERKSSRFETERPPKYVETRPPPWRPPPAAVEEPEEEREGWLNGYPLLDPPKITRKEEPVSDEPSGSQGTSAKATV